MIGNDDSYYGRSEMSNSDMGAVENYFMPRSFVLDVTAAYRFGNLIDAMITGAHRVNHYMRTIDNETFVLEDWEKALRMRDAFMGDAECANLYKLASGQNVMRKEAMNITYRGFDFSVPARCKWDLWMPPLKWGADIKSTTATTQKQFEDACRHFKYTRQRAWYMDIADSERDLLIGISKVNFKVFKIRIKRGDDFYTTGKEQYQQWAFYWWAYFNNFIP
jgi:PDDEXK-like domain of unknown function (DUF3799)